MWLGVLGRGRGVELIAGVTAREGVCEREGGRKDEKGLCCEDCVVEIDEVMGDQGRDEAIDTLERLRL